MSFNLDPASSEAFLYLMERNYNFMAVQLRPVLYNIPKAF